MEQFPNRQQISPGRERTYMDLNESEEQDRNTAADAQRTDGQQQNFFFSAPAGKQNLSKQTKNCQIKEKRIPPHPEFSYGDIRAEQIFPQRGSLFTDPESVSVDDGKFANAGFPVFCVLIFYPFRTVGQENQ